MVIIIGQCELVLYLMCNWLVSCIQGMSTKPCTCFGYVHALLNTLAYSYLSIWKQYTCCDCSRFSCVFNGWCCRREWGNKVRRTADEETDSSEWEPDKRSVCICPLSVCQHPLCCCIYTHMYACTRMFTYLSWLVRAANNSIDQQCNPCANSCSMSIFKVLFNDQISLFQL